MRFFLLELLGGLPLPLPLRCLDEEEGVRKEPARGVLVVGVEDGVARKSADLDLLTTRFLAEDSAGEEVAE